MFKTVLRKTLYEKRWMLLAWSVGVFAMTFFTVVLFPNFREFDQLAEDLPESLRSLLGSAESYRTIAGYVGQQIYGPQIPIFTIIMSIVLFVGISAGDEDQGILQNLLSQPVSRIRVFLEKAGAAFIILGAACLAIAAGVLIPLVIINESMSLVRLLEATIAVWLITIGFGVVAYGVAMATGKKGLAIGVASGYAFACFLVASLAPSVKLLRPVEKFSLFYYYDGAQVPVSGLEWQNVIIMVGFCVITLATSLFLFRRRDLS